MRVSFLLFCMMLVCPVAGIADDQADAKAGRIMWVGFECFELAQLANNQEAAERLFELSYQAGKRFMGAIEAGKISNEIGYSILPIGLIGLLSGPSHDFVIGRVFEAATLNANDKVIRQDHSGFPLATDDWVLDEDLKKLKAANLFSKANCEAL